MQLLIRQRVFSWSDTYEVYDQFENPKYFVKAEVFSLGHVIHVYDQHQRELGCIRQRLLTLMPKLELELNGQFLGEIKKEFTLFRQRYYLECNGWEIDGGFLGWDYSVMDGERTVMSISKELFHWGDTYVLNIADPRDEVLCLMVAIAIDAANCGNGN